jgi:hypothetical protein
LISTHFLEGQVFEMIRATMLDPGKLRGRIEIGSGPDDRSTAPDLASIARKIGALDHDRRELISRYAADQMTNDEYTAANRALDEKVERLVRAKAKLVTALRSTHHEDFVGCERPANLCNSKGPLAGIVPPRPSNCFALRNLYSITSSARSRIDCGTARPSALAVFRFTALEFCRQLNG